MMIKYVLIFVAVVLSMLGLAEFFHGVRLLCISPKKHAKTYSVIFLEDSCAEQQLNFAVEQYTWMGYSYADKIIAVYSGLSDENKENCRLIAEKYDITYCEEDRLKSEIHNLRYENNDI